MNSFVFVGFITAILSFLASVGLLLVKFINWNSVPALDKLQKDNLFQNHALFWGVTGGFIALFLFSGIYEAEAFMKGKNTNISRRMRSRSRK